MEAIQPAENGSDGSAETPQVLENLGTFKAFLESSPPTHQMKIKDLCSVAYSGSGHTQTVKYPDIELFCSTSTCGNGKRIFRTDEWENATDTDKWKQYFVTYTCSNCRSMRKIFALLVLPKKRVSEGEVHKLGEIPAFGFAIPARVISLIGRDRELFLKGQKSEQNALGIGAFAYYRRVVENQKNEIFNQIIKVAQKIGGYDELITDLEHAKKETQFDKAMKVITHGLPPNLLVDGRNPLALLHASLSEGVHNMTDEECLSTAHSIRVVLADLAENMAIALRREAELSKAVAHLHAIQSKKYQAKAAQAQTSASGTPEPPKI